VFSIANLVATAAWIALVILPGRRWVTGIVTSTAVPLLFALVYVGIVATTFGRTPGGFSTLADVTTLFSNPWALLAGWIHYLAFDLLIGTWETRDCTRARRAASAARSVPGVDVPVWSGRMAALSRRATDEVLADAPESLFGVVISELARRFASIGIEARGDAGHVGAAASHTAVSAPCATVRPGRARA
jgi:hypothetical protein